MASNYPGNPTAVQSPGPQPLPGSVPVISIPAGTDARSIESISQALKENTDFAAALMNRHLWSVDQENFLMANETLSTNASFANYGKLQCVLSAGASGSVAIGNQRALVTPTSAGGFTYVAYGGTIAAPSNGQITVEFDFTANTDNVGSNYYMGIGNVADLHSATTVAMVYFDPAVSATKWRLKVTGVTDINLASSMSLGTRYRIRIECYSATSAVGVANGNTALTRVYVNNALDSSVNAAVLSGYVAAGAASISAPGNGTATVNCITTQWTRF